MNKKVLIILASLIGVVIIFAIVILLLSFNDKLLGDSDFVKKEIKTEKVNEKKDQEPEKILQTTIEKESDVAKKPATTNKIKTAQATTQDISAIAVAFSERFGSYSNHSNYKNLTNLQPFMSEKMKKWSSNFVKSSQEQSEGYYDIYYGITTKALSYKILSYSIGSGKAIVLVKTIRRESTGTKTNTKNFYQDITVTLVKEGETWKIDGANWE